jgi:hypothetical protein
MRQNSPIIPGDFACPPPPHPGRYQSIPPLPAPVCPWGKEPKHPPARRTWAVFQRYTSFRSATRTTSTIRRSSWIS